MGTVPSVPVRKDRFYTRELIHGSEDAFYEFGGELIPVPAGAAESVDWVTMRWTVRVTKRVRALTGDEREGTEGRWEHVDGVPRAPIMRGGAFLPFDYIAHGTQASSIEKILSSGRMLPSAALREGDSTDIITGSDFTRSIFFHPCPSPSDLLQRLNSLDAHSEDDTFLSGERPVMLVFRSSMWFNARRRFAMTDEHGRTDVLGGPIGWDPVRAAIARAQGELDKVPASQRRCIVNAFASVDFLSQHKFASKCRLSEEDFFLPFTSSTKRANVYEAEVGIEAERGVPIQGCTVVVANTVRDGGLISRIRAMCSELGIGFLHE